MGNKDGREPKFPQKTPKKKKSRNFIRIFLLTLLIFVLIGIGGTASIVYSFIKDAPEFDPTYLKPALTSYLYDINREEITTLYEEQNRIEVPLNKIPIEMQNAFIAIEDERFRQHKGFDIIGIFRAFLANIREQRIEQGGSTITQQLVKNAFLTPEQTIKRKIQEIWLALNMERQYTKDEILEMYLNRIYFGHGAYGVEAAAQLYFNKSVEELNLAEIAMLAGIPRSPNYYSPYNNPHIAKERQELVLRKMVDIGFISEAEAREARETPVEVGESPPDREYPFPYFVDYVVHHELINILTDLPQYEDKEEAYNAIYTGGLKIYTTLNPDIQQSIEQVLSNASNYPINTVDENGIEQPQSAAVAANPVNGQIYALVGGREYSKKNQVLRFTSTRQPGSAIKPIVVYAPAMEEGLITPGTVVDDSPFVQGNYAPENFNRRFVGLTTVREALVLSLNVPAVRVFKDLTPDKGIAYAERMGISTFVPQDYGLATALGGLTYGVTPIDMAQAFGVLANQGIKVQLHTVEKIEDRDGNVIYDFEAEPEAVLSPQTAYLMTDILKDVVRRGTASRLRVGRPVAAKTGTTSDNRDAYLVAYTPQLVVSFWMGFDKQEMGKIPGGSGATITFMNQILSSALKDMPSEDFPKPPGLTGPISICKKSGLRPGPDCPPEEITSEIFPSNNVPRGTCDMHVKIEVCEESGLLPGEYCPEESIVEKVFLNRPPFLITDHRWAGGAGRGPADANLAPPKDTCNVHTEQPAQPVNLSAEIKNNKIILWWEPGDTTAVKYTILRRIGSGEYELLSTQKQTQFKENISQFDTTYYYQVIAINQSGVSSPPAEIAVKIPPEEEKPEPPEPTEPEPEPEPEPPSNGDENGNDNGSNNGNGNGNNNNNIRGNRIPELENIVKNVAFPFMLILKNLL